MADLVLDAKLSKAAYSTFNQSTTPVIEGWQPISLPIEFFNIQTTDRSFAAQMYEKAGQFKVVYRGTIPTVADWANNPAIVGVWQQEMTDTIRFAGGALRFLMERRGMTFDAAQSALTTTGHSQGGFQSELAAKFYGLSGTSMDGPGMAQFLLSPMFNTTLRNEQRALGLVDLQNSYSLGDFQVRVYTAVGRLMVHDNDTSVSYSMSAKIAIGSWLAGPLIGGATTAVGLSAHLLDHIIATERLRAQSPIFRIIGDASDVNDAVQLAGDISVQWALVAAGTGSGTVTANQIQGMIEGFLTERTGQEVSIRQDGKNVSIYAPNGDNLVIFSDGSGQKSVGIGIGVVQAEYAPGGLVVANSLFQRDDDGNTLVVRTSAGQEVSVALDEFGQLLIGISKIYDANGQLVTQARLIHNSDGTFTTTTTDGVGTFILSGTKKIFDDESSIEVVVDSGGTTTTIVRDSTNAIFRESNDIATLDAARAAYDPGIPTSVIALQTAITNYQQTVELEIGSCKASIDAYAQLTELAPNAPSLNTQFLNFVEGLATTAINGLLSLAGVSSAQAAELTAPLNSQWQQKFDNIDTATGNGLDAARTWLAGTLDGIKSVASADGVSNPVSTGASDDWLFLGAGNNVANSGDGRDLISGGAGSDTLYGGAGADTLFGGDGSDTLIGGAGSDRLDGGAGNDALDAWDGAFGDVLVGGAGDDTYRIDVGAYPIDEMTTSYFGNFLGWYEAATTGAGEADQIVDSGSGGNDSVAMHTTLRTPGTGNSYFIQQIDAQYGLMKWDSNEALVSAPFQNIEVDVALPVYALYWQGSISVAGNTGNNLIRSFTPLNAHPYFPAETKLIGGEGDDTLEAIGGGRKLLSGGFGNDTYVFGIGGGTTHIFEGDVPSFDVSVYDNDVPSSPSADALWGTDRVLLRGLTPSDVSIDSITQTDTYYDFDGNFHVHEHGNLTLTILATNEKLTIYDQIDNLDSLPTGLQYHVELIGDVPSTVEG